MIFYINIYNTRLPRVTTGRYHANKTAIGMKKGHNLDS